MMSTSVHMGSRAAAQVVAMRIRAFAAIPHLQVAVS